MQADEMKKWGDVGGVFRYLKKAQSLDAKLQLAAEKIDAYNVEESSFGWEQTNFPRRAEILAAMKPFLALYETANDFDTKRDDWLFGARAHLQPDDIEQELGAFNRAMFKMEKSFADCPPAHSIASTTRARVDNMRERLPLIHALCNPGMRPRHWEMVSAVVGRPIEPTDQTTLQDIISMRLDDYIEQFEPIAEAASKEFALEKARSVLRIFTAVFGGLPEPKVTRWCNGKALDLRSVGRGFKSCSKQRCVTTLGKLFTPMCLCRQAV